MANKLKNSANIDKETLSKWTWTVSQMGAFFNEQISCSYPNTEGKIKDLSFSVCFDAEIWDYDTAENERPGKTMHPVLWLNLSDKGEIFADLMCDSDLMYKVIGYLAYHKIPIKSLESS